MNKYFVQIGSLILIIALLLLEKGLYGTFALFNFLPLSLILIIYLINSKNGSSFVGILFIYGLLLDLINKGFLGFTSLAFIVCLYLFYVTSIRFRQNKYALTFINFAFITVLSLGYYGLGNYTVEVLYTGIIVAVVGAWSWIKN